MLNAYMADLCSRQPQITGTATVFPGEEGAADILVEAFQLGCTESNCTLMFSVFTWTVRPFMRYVRFVQLTRSR